MRLLLQEQFQGDVHYVWCGSDFDAKARAGHSFSSLVADSSTPKSIYRSLKHACESSDRGNPVITRVRALYLALGAEWKRDGKITDFQLEELTALVQENDFNLWRPLLYVIHADAVAARLEEVPFRKRSSPAPEYIISDLKRSEFDIVEF